MNEEELVQTEPVDETTENTDAQTVEEFGEGIELTDTASSEGKKEVKQYTDEEIERLVNEKVNDLLPKKLEREKRKIDKDYREKLAKYEETESILSAGLGTKDIAESNKKMREFYEEQGINIPAYQKPSHSEEDERALGELDAKKVISLGFEEMQEEANRLADIGNDKMSPREKVMFTTLAAELTRQKQVKELAQIGVKGELLKDEDFKSFASQFDYKTPIKKVYEYYTQLIKPKKQVEKMGSMKTGPSGKVKDFYTEEEIAALSDDDLDNPQIWDAVRKSMTGQ